MGLIEAAVDVGTGIAGLIGNRKDKLAAENAANKSWQRNYEAQKEFAQNSLSWRVQDAKRAGINPYAAIGGQTPGYTPQDSSYTTGYQGAMSQAMNKFSNALGQLEMANLRAEVKGKEIDNNKKALELVNAQLAANLGNTSRTLQNPYNKAHTDPVKDWDGFHIQTLGKGQQIFNVDGGAEIDDPQAFSNYLHARWSPDMYRLLAQLNRGGKIGMSFSDGGYVYYPPGTEQYLHPVNEWSAKIADQIGVLPTLGITPGMWLGYGAYRAGENYIKKSKSPRSQKSYSHWDSLAY